MRKAYDENYQTFLKKNADYGSSFEKSLEQLGEVAGIVRISDKYNRLVNLTKNENKVLESKSDTVNHSYLRYRLEVGASWVLC